jgi:alkyl hydroperoxide reductase subunit AhpC
MVLVPEGLRVPLSVGRSGLELLRKVQAAKFVRARGY